MADAADTPVRWRTGRMVRRILLVLVALGLLPFALSIVYAVVPPPSTLMLARWVTFQPVTRDWVPLERISPSLVRAVITAEDQRFCTHGGVDWDELRAVIEDADEDGPSRGASTITMQTAKNLFLWQGGGYLRKPFEIVLALWLDLVLSKSRVMEIYLNIAEWGPDGIFGAEASAQRAFRKPAANLSAAEAATMAAALPNPVLRDPKAQSRGGRRWAATVAARARGGGAPVDCVLGN